MGALTRQSRGDLASGAPPRKRGRPKGARLSQTDHAVLGRISQEGFQTYAELRAGPLQHLHRVYAWDRMRRLVRLGFLSQYSRDGRGILGWSIAPKAVATLRSAGNPLWAQARAGPRYCSAFEHDLVLREIKQILCRSKAVTHWEAEDILKKRALGEQKYISGADRFEKLLYVPDAILHIAERSGEWDAALELELTRKSKARIYRKLKSYLTTHDFSCAFFIMRDNSLLQVYNAIDQEVRSTSLKVKMTSELNAIYFVLLENLRRDKLNASFQGEEGIFSFADLAPLEPSFNLTT